MFTGLYRKVQPLFVFLLLVFLIAAGGGGAADASGNTATIDTSGIVKTTLDNGLTILINPNAENEVVDTQLLIKAGRAYETEGKYGVSALLQKVITRGTGSASAAQIDSRLETYGAWLDTGSEAEYSMISLKSTREVFLQCLPILCDMIRNPAFPKEEIEKERAMLIQEIAGAGDQPANIADDNFLKSFYGASPYGVTAARLSQSIAAMGREDLLAWYHRTYVGSNMVLSIVGKVNAPDLVKKLKAALGDLPAGEALSPNGAGIPEHDRDAVITQVKQTQALFMILGYPAPEMHNADWPAMAVLNWMLGGGGMSSRLFSELREQKSLAYDVDSSYFKLFGPSYIEAFIATAPENYQAARDGIVAAFQRFTVETVSAAELATAKQAVRGRFVMAHETNAGRAEIAGRYELLGLGYPFEMQYPLLIDRVSAADVQRVAQKYFRHYTLSVVAPTEIK